MSDDGTQEMLFGSLETAGPDRETTATDQLRLCSLNVNSPSSVRAQRLLDWTLTTGANTVVLTELQAGDGANLLVAGLAAEGFTVHTAHDRGRTRFFTLVATHGFDTSAVQPEPFDPRIVTVDLTLGPATVRLVGVYGPTNGMTADSSDRRRLFQQQLLNHLKTIGSSHICLAGDLNVVEPGHQPTLATFEQHDYDFYGGLLQLGLYDAYRATNPTGGHSWISDRFGAQRLDHALIHPDAGTLEHCAYDHTPRLAGHTDHAALLATVHLTR